MSWRTAAAILIAVFAVLLLQTVLADPLFGFLSAVTDLYDTSGGQIDGNSLIDGLGGAWMNMGLIMVFGLVLWGAVRVLRQELTRGRI
jgi:hypothetical protein